MHTLNPQGTLIQAALLALGAGVGWALLAAWVIYAGSTLLSPRLRVGEVWSGWRRKWWLWTGSLLLTALGCAWAEEWVLNKVGFRDLFWFTTRGDMYVVCRTGAASGYLLVLALFTLGAMILRARAGKKAGGPATRQTPGPNHPPGAGPNRP